MKTFRIICKSQTQRDLIITCVRQGTPELEVSILDEFSAILHNTTAAWRVAIRNMGVKVEE